MGQALEATELLRSFMGSKERRNSLISQALDSSAAVIWTTDMEGTVTMCEGGGLLMIGGSPGHCVGVNMMGATQIPFEDALQRLRKGEPVVKYVVRGLLTSSFPDRESLLNHPWLVSLSYLRSASGKPTGVACVTIPLHGATPLSVFSECPLSSCMLEGHRDV